MAFRHGRTDDPSNPGNNSRTRILERLLIQHAEEGIELIELRVQKGKSGYVPTPHYWRNEGDGDDLSDEDGTFLLIGGMAPIDLATEIVDTAREYADETGEHRNYRVVAYRVAPQGPEDPGEEAFRVGLPASMFSPPEEIQRSDASMEQHEVMMNFLQQMARQNDTQFRMTMDVLRQFPTIVSKTTSLVEQLGDQLGGDRDNNAQHVATVLQYQAEREQRWMEHDRAKQRHGNRSDLLARSIDIAGPDLMQLVREIVRRMKEGTNEGPTVDTTATEPGESPSSGSKPGESPPQPGSALAAELDAVFEAVPDGGLGKAETLLTKDEWRVIESARRAPSDAEFLALFGRLHDLLLERGRPDLQALEGRLLLALGPDAALALKSFLEQVKAHQARTG